MIRGVAILPFVLAGCRALPYSIPAVDRMERPPRKVVVGTVVQGLWGPYPGAEKRAEELCDLIDQMAREAAERYSGSRLDLVIFPEQALTGRSSSPAAERAVPMDTPAVRAIRDKAREHETYVVLPLDLLEDPERGVRYNAAALLGRDRRVVGLYRKVHPVPGPGPGEFEGGLTPGQEFPVFDCDFGRLGIQICYDINFEDGWRALARKGAEIVAWPTQSPQTALPARRAAEGGFYVVSSTWRHNASIFDPVGMTPAQVRLPGRILVHQIDLSHAILGWSAGLRNGRALAERYGDRVGYRYYESEDRGVFWSNDPSVTIGEMIRSLGLVPLERQVARDRKLQEAARGAPAD